MAAGEGGSTSRLTAGQLVEEQGHGEALQQEPFEEGACKA